MKPWGRVAFLAIVAAQLALLIGFIGVREAALQTVTDVVLQTATVDPRSLLQRIDANLDYDIARLPSWMDELSAGSTVYVLLQEEVAVWTASAHAEGHSSTAGVGFIKSRIDRVGHAYSGIGPVPSCTKGRAASLNASGM